MISENALQQLISQGESLQTEFKSSRVHPDALAATFVSFLNTNGGILLLWVEDDKTISGIENVDTACQRVEQILANNITPQATYCVCISLTGELSAILNRKEAMKCR